jgi:adenylylsulfate kinase-like enzyme
MKADAERQRSGKVTLRAYSIKTQLINSKIESDYAFDSDDFCERLRDVEKVANLKFSTAQTISSASAVSCASNSFREAQANLNCEFISEVSVFCDIFPSPFSVICKLVVWVSKSACKILETNRRRKAVLW